MIISNIIDSWKHIPYTLRHYIAFLKTEKKYIGYYKYKFHDLDKVLMYIIIPWLGTSRKYTELLTNIISKTIKLLMSAREYLEYKKDTLRDVHYAHMDMVMKQFNL